MMMRMMIFSSLFLSVFSPTIMAGRFNLQLRGVDYIVTDPVLTAVVLRRWVMFILNESMVFPDAIINLLCRASFTPLKGLYSREIACNKTFT